MSKIHDFSLKVRMILQKYVDLLNYSKWLTDEHSLSQKQSFEHIKTTCFSSNGNECEFSKKPFKCANSA